MTHVISLEMLVVTIRGTIGLWSPKVSVSLDETKRNAHSFTIFSCQST